MRRIAQTTTVAIALGLLGGCSGASAGGSVCKDSISAQAYGVKWQDDLAAARQAGKISMEEAMDAQGESYKKLSLLNSGKYAEFCEHLDKVRAETKF